jgi:crotonobetainyl-CoA:carnitine CoA-transferase CaiB-like acyl-CoA transferase
MTFEASLSGLTVIDLTRGVAGPYATKLLADQGADVIKLEPPNGDPSRRFGPFPGDTPHPERSGLFLHLNRGKRSVEIDAGTEQGAAFIRGLAADADLVIEDYAPGDAARWGWGYDALKALNPAIVLASVTAFGQTGPYRDYRGSELTLQAIGGALYTNGHETREPLKLAGHFAHYHAALMLAFASLTAMRRAAASGAGDWIDLSVYECQAGCRDRQCMYVTMAGYCGLSMGRARASIVRLGAGVRACADGYVNIMGAATRLPKLLTLIGRADLIGQPNIAGPTGTVATALVEEVESAYQVWLTPRPKAEVVAAARAAGLLAAAVNTVGDVMEDPHFEARGIWETIDHPYTGPLRYPGRPFMLSASPNRQPLRAPLLNEHAALLETVPARPDEADSGAATPDLRLPLSGLRVAEITVVWAGPHVTQLLAEWGADVIRVEPTDISQPYTRGMEEVPSKAQAAALAEQGVPTRLVDGDPRQDPWNRSAAFNSHARNKRSMACNIMSPEGRESLLRLAAHCDVLVENNVPVTMDKAGITWAALKAVNPRLIWLRMPALALDGPNRDFRAFGLHVEAMIGHTHLRGYPGESPQLLSESLASDGIAGVQGAVAVMMALRHRQKTGQGQLIEMPLAEGFLPTFAEFILDHSMNGRDTPTQGNRHPWHAPHGVFECAGDDNWLALDVATDAEFAAVAKVLEAPELAQDPRFAKATNRRKNTGELHKILTSLTSARDKEQLFHALQSQGVCATPVRKATEVLADAHLEERGFFEQLPTGDEQKLFPYPGLSFRMSRTPNHIRSGPVRLGEHNHEIYCELLGYSEAQLAELKQKGLVDTRYPHSMWAPAL